MIFKILSASMNQPQYTNRLIKEKSPYLLQHAHNPVDWYPWGEEAFAAAQQQDKPIFLSIGYATCHWCHVMEKESFENREIAELLNDAFINIKVDREELPEVDSLYMEFAQSMMSGAAGWPLNVIITPDLKPFFAATYLPPQTQRGLMGVKDLVARISEVWESDDREQLINQASKVVDVFAENVHYKGTELPEKELVGDAADNLFRLSDPVYGGMKGAPKFPIGYQINFMLHYFYTSKDSRSVFLAERTLDMMHRGGIYDHLGGGFSRYSVDEKWLVPHFEKMLYDNALLISSYLEAWQLTKNSLYSQVCNDIIQYLLRDMTHSEGGFFSAQDADSEGHEGLFYTWTQEEIERLLGTNESKLFCDFYGVTAEGNFEHRNILHTALSLPEFAAKVQQDPQVLALIFYEQRKILWNAREKRKHPLKDDKILSSWNGLMIDSLARAGTAFSEKNYIDEAVKAARFIYEFMWDGSLYRRWREEESSHQAGIDEYAFLIRGLLTLFEADRGVEWLDWAIKMTAILKQKFKAPEGAFFQTDGTDPSIILRKCQFSDGAEPSGNAIHCENLLRLYQLTGVEDYLEQAEDILSAVKKYIDNYSPGYSYHMMNLNHFYDAHAPTIVVALNETEDDKELLSQQIFTQFIPHKAVIWRHPQDEKLFQLIPFTKEQVPLDGKTTVYICFEGVCKKPLNEVKEIVNALQKI